MLCCAVLTNTIYIHILHLLRFDAVTDLVGPVSDGIHDRCFISKSYDATSHFETAADDVLSLYERITGTQLDMNINADSIEDENM